ncbi:MAG: hypothetical protein ACRDSF_23315 [Pseudonocardiaceae bacterium]
MLAQGRGQRQQLAALGSVDTLRVLCLVVDGVVEHVQIAAAPLHDGRHKITTATSQMPISDAITAFTGMPRATAKAAPSSAARPTPEARRTFTRG